jgi:hypothetical protein
MKRGFSLSLLTLAVLTGFAGCNGGGHGAPLPSLSATDDLNALSLSSSLEGSSHYLWGYYAVSIDKQDLTAEIVPIRATGGHLNVLQFLEQAPCGTCFKIKGVFPNPDGTLDVNVAIKHPFTNKNLTGFDVRGIAMFNGSHEFPASGLLISDGTMGDGEIVNADGYTTLYNPGTEGNGFEGYIKGKLATVIAPCAALNGYRRFWSYDPANTRNAFYAGDNVMATFRVYLPDAPNPWVFGYAIDASWTPAVNKPVQDPMTDFGPDANCPEAWQISVSDVPISAGLTDLGGQVSVVIDIFDWQGKDDAHPPLVECPELFGGQTEAIWTEDGTGFSRYEAVVENLKLAPAGMYLCLVGKEAAENDPADKPWLDLSAYAIHELNVTQTIEGEGWARTWGDGELGTTGGNGVAMDDSGNAYVTGYFALTVDFDPGSGEDLHVCTGGWDVFLSKFDPAGNFLWAKTWGGLEAEVGNDVAVDSSGNVYVTGYFTGTVDFDPGVGVDNHTSAGNWDMFMSKFDSGGTFLWAKTWGGPGIDDCMAVAVDSSDNAYVTGHFRQTVDFDPGGGEDSHKTNGLDDVFLSRFDSSGDFLWAKTWGGPSDDDGYDVAVDGAGNPYVIGCYTLTVDFDPGSGVDERDSNGVTDVFLSKFDPSGNVLWTDTWGGIWGDEGFGVAVDDSGNASATGDFIDKVDFDPGSGVDIRTSHGYKDAFLSRFDSSGALLWVRTWGGSSSGTDAGSGIAIDGLGNAYVIGSFMGTADFDPGSGKDDHVSNGGNDSFLSRIDSSGDFIWARTWGGITEYEGPSDVATDDSGSSYVTGYFSDTADFDPGDGVDNHTPNGFQDAFLSRFLPDGSW